MAGELKAKVVCFTPAPLGMYPRDLLSFNIVFEGGVGAAFSPAPHPLQPLLPPGKTMLRDSKSRGYTLQKGQHPEGHCGMTLGIGEKHPEGVSLGITTRVTVR